MGDSKAAIVGRCEWCSEVVHADFPRYVNGRRVWHSDCHEHSIHMLAYAERVDVDSGSSPTPTTTKDSTNE